MKIRDANETDLERCEELLSYPEFQFAGGRYPEKEFIKNYIEKDYFLVAEENKEIIGLILGEPIKSQVAVIWFISVEKNTRGEGIGTKLINEFEKRMTKIKRRIVLLYGLQDNEKTLNFYRKKNYNEGKSQVEFTKKLF